MTMVRNAVTAITGAGSGLGRALAVAFAQAGSELALSDVDEGGLQETVRLVAPFGRGTSQHVVDVSSSQAVQTYADRVRDTHGRLNVLVNNAGVVAFEEFATQSLSDFEWVMRVNFFGAVFGCKAFLPLLRSQPEAHIVNISSMAGFVGMAEHSAYSASKAALRAFSESLSIELSQTGVHVSCVAPGATRTQIAVAARGAKASKAAIGARVQRGVAPEGVAHAVVRAVQDNRFLVIPTTDARIMNLSVRLAPEGVRRALAFGHGRAGR